MERLEEIFCDIDDFCRVFIPQWHEYLLTSGQRERQRACRLSMGEIMTLLILGLRGLVWVIFSTPGQGWQKSRDDF